MPQLDPILRGAENDRLYITAFLLPFIGFTNIAVLEASSRIGGHIHTHYFKVGESCNHSCYDIGTMRTPLFQGAS